MKWHFQFLFFHLCSFEEEEKEQQEEENEIRTNKKKNTVKISNMINIQLCIRVCRAFFFQTIYEL